MAKAWIVGRSGLLGSAIARGHRHHHLHDADRIPWQNAPSAIDTLQHELDRFLGGIGRGDAWAIYWAAGVGVISSGREALDSESTIVSTFAERLGQRTLPGRGAFFLSSSASVYAGADGAPYHEGSIPSPTSDYARSKLKQEAAVAEHLDGVLPHVVGRISTLYGPGQSLSKSQGLVSRMALRAARREPIEIFVPADTLRDYIYVDDAAAQVRRFTELARDSRQRVTRIRNVAHGTSYSITQIAALTRAVSRRRLGIWQSARGYPTGHVRDLRIVTDHRVELQGLPHTPPPVGIAQVYSDILRQVRTGS